MIIYVKVNEMVYNLVFMIYSTDNLVIASYHLLPTPTGVQQALLECRSLEQIHWLPIELIGFFVCVG